MKILKVLQNIKNPTYDLVSHRYRRFAMLTPVPLKEIHAMYRMYDDWGELSASRPCRFTPGERSRCIRPSTQAAQEPLDGFSRSLKFFLICEDTFQCRLKWNKNAEHFTWDRDAFLSEYFSEGKRVSSKFRIREARFVFNIIFAHTYVLYLFEQIELNAQQLLSDTYIFKIVYSRVYDYKIHKKPYFVNRAGTA
jgi:hypothetical protein